MLEADLVVVNDKWHVYDAGRRPCYDMNDMLGQWANMVLCVPMSR